MSEAIHTEADTKDGGFGAPTSLAVSLAGEAGLVLYGFTSPTRTVRYA